MTLEEFNEYKQKINEMLATMEEFVIDNETEPIHKDITFDENEICFVARSSGSVVSNTFTKSSPTNQNALNNHRLFKYLSEAKMFDSWCQLIADMYYFKRVYDADYVPNWNNNSQAKWSVYYSHDVNHYKVTHNYESEDCSVPFSSREIARKCADWLEAGKPRFDEWDK